MEERDKQADAMAAPSPTAEPPAPIVVGIGASVGALAALKELVATIPVNSGLAFVVVAHLRLDEETDLADLLRPHSVIPIGLVSGDTHVEPNRAYVIPPGRNLSVVDSHLRLAPLAPKGAGRQPVDHFFTTLATTHDGASVGVILSGAGEDGAQGIAYIRGQGGLTIAQNPTEAECDEMPRSAIDTHLVDHILPLSEMMPCILEFAATRTPSAHKRGVSKVNMAALEYTQAALTRSEDRHALLVMMHDATRSLGDPNEVQRVASRLLGNHLHASHVNYAIVDGRYISVRNEAIGDALALPNVPLPEFSEAFLDTYDRDEVLVLADVQKEGGLDVVQRALYRAAGVGAVVGALFRKDGHWSTGLSVYSETTRAWSANEVALIRDFGARMSGLIEAARAEETLRASEERYRLIVEGALDYVIFTVDLQGCILTWPPGAEAVLGWTPADALGRHFEMTFTSQDRAEGIPLQELVQARATGIAPDVRWHTRKDGSFVFIDGVSRALTDGTGSIVGILKVGQDVTGRREMERSLRELNQSLEARVIERTAQLETVGRLTRENEQRFRRRLTQAEEEERRHLARDLHDEAGQSLTALGLGLQAIFASVPAGSILAARAAALQKLTETLGRELHAVAVRLRPKALDDFGLEVALRTHAEDWARTVGISVALHAPVNNHRLPDHLETALYRIVQEALTNIARHSGARGASVVVERREQQVVAIIEDNGRGFDASLAWDSPVGSGVGLRGIQERVALFGGTVEIESTLGTGTTIFVRIPIDSEVATSNAASECPS